MMANKRSCLGVAALFAAASCNTWSDPSPPRLGLFVGGDELPELQRQSREFTERACAEHLPVTMMTLAGRNHYTIMEELAAPDGMLTSALIRMIHGSATTG